MLAPLPTTSFSSVHLKISTEMCLAQRTKDECAMRQREDGQNTFFDTIYDLIKADLVNFVNVTKLEEANKVSTQE